MTDLTTVLRDLSEKAGKAPFSSDEATDYFNAVSDPALIQALVEVVLLELGMRQAKTDDEWCILDDRLDDALRRLEAVAQHLQS